MKKSTLTMNKRCRSWYFIGPEKWRRVRCYIEHGHQGKHWAGGGEMLILKWERRAT